MSLRKKNIKTTQCKKTWQKRQAHFQEKKDACVKNKALDWLIF